MRIGEDVRRVVENGRLAHLVTINPDGSPQVTCVWVGIENGEIVCGHLGAWQKVRNVRRDPRVTLSIEADGVNAIGLANYLVVHGRARVTEGGAPALLQQLARRYLGPDVVFPPMPNPPGGFVMRIAPERFGGVGPWTGAGAE